MQIDNLSWFPGHMTKTKRMISAEIKNMDAVCEIVDARIPLSSRNPDVDELTAGKPRLIVLNRADQADPAETRRWTQYFRAQGYAVLEANAKNGVGTEKFSAAVRELLRDKLAAAAARGQVGKVVRVMVLGVPNVGKSTFINKVAHRKTAKAEDRPGVTRSKQWVPIDRNLELLDTPGILWPKFDDQSVGMNLAYTGAVKDDILDVETLGCHLMAYLGEHYPDALKTAYKLSALPEREAEEKSRLGMNIRRDDSVWRAELPSSEARPDELRPLERRHVVRAYADFMDSDDASLTIGPELMLKDEHNEWGKKSRPEENDPSVGLGMQFSLDF